MFRWPWAQRHVIKRRLRRHLVAAWMQAAPVRRRVASHNLPGELVVSLTSYPARFQNLHLTLKSLLRQDVRPDRIVLWLAHGDVDRLPARVRRLQRVGLQIRSADDTRSFKKIVPALLDFPNAFIVTADDDVYYPRAWLRGLVEGFSPAAPSIVCHRAHLPTFDSEGDTRCYQDWEWEVRCPEGSRVIMPTGVGGILYPPRVLHPLVTDEALFTELCPLADDLWLYFMGRLNGVVYRSLDKVFDQIEWIDGLGLWFTNVQGGRNDAQIAQLEARFGRIKDLHQGSADTLS